ncbi:hypothetical protein GJ496_011084 [Pomphorhynchus laevis]|nr:hypothetical protein GJ496_011084 [Pomphorhynchus laevis]
MKRNSDTKLEIEDDPHNIPLTIDVNDEKDEKLKDAYTPEKNESMIKIVFSGKLPKSFGLIIGNEFCERFCFYGLRAILTLYMIEYLGQSNVTATNIYHIFTLLAYFLPIFGAILSDSWLGKFKTILILSIVYAIGTTLMSLLAIPSIGNKNLAGVIVALLIIAVGTGGIKPCVSSFGADQFQGETKYLECFFNAFYMSINAGSVLSMIITPLLKGIQCLQPADDPQCENTVCDCYALSFGLPAILMVIAILFFVAGTKIYIKVPPQGSMLLKFVKSIYSALKNKITKVKARRNINHWLDNASEEYDLTTLDDFKQVLSVIKVFAPLCFFWTLFDQTGSTWIIQGRMMSHKLGNWNLTPDLIQAVNPILVLIMVPLFDGVIYPFFAKFKFLTKPLHRMVAGMLFAALSFVVAGFIQVAVINDIKSQTNDSNITTFTNQLVTVQNNLPCLLNIRNTDMQTVMKIAKQQAKAIRNVGYTDVLYSSCTKNSLTMADIPGALKFIEIDMDANGSITALVPSQLSAKQHGYSINSNPLRLFHPHFFPRIIKSEEETKQSSVHILFQLFQYIILTAGEVLFSISGLHFAYAELKFGFQLIKSLRYLVNYIKI